MGRRVLFLDRDGVINIDYGYVHQIETFHFMEGIFDLTRHAVRLGYGVVVVTNQAGIARGYYTEAQFHHLTAWMVAEFAHQGVPVERVYFSPCHPTEGIGIYRREDPSRKPAPGMILQARQELDVDLAASVLIGDRISDMQAGMAAGVGCNLWYQPQPVADSSIEGCHIIATLHAALPYL
ncbi:MAG: D-glycero-beta-D-manno-heptose 1,7-bisphosphate 7-phosphatase [Magnetococcales bacterium]|nr:D-glycero-beta-D-manno-heptose 1,7-bisphosphate 7-phosphatase [Magnetococcales bacterium]